MNRKEIRPGHEKEPVDRTKLRYALFLIGAAVLILLGLLLAGSVYWEHNQPAFQNGPQLILALQAFLHDCARSGKRPPSEISLQDLIRGGYLAPNDVRAFEGMDVTFSTEADASNPQSVLARARTADGAVICLLADGSVQQFSRRAYETMMTNSVNPPASRAPSP